MINWINFFILFFWLILGGILINSTNFLNTMLIAELVWITLYVLSILIGVTNDDLILFSLSFFILALASLEFCIGFLLVILFRYFFKTIDFGDVNKKNNNLKNNFGNSNVRRYTLL